ncbi:MAG: hypothetical protein RIQ89_63 [Bacteroidota bacterium]|jgi:hypothetical protein
MAVYRFRITFEDHDEVSRDIEIKSTQTFLDLHKAIHAAIEFDGAKEASFYMSDDNWKKGKEITNRTNAAHDTVHTLEKSRLCDFIIDPHQKIYYIFDPVAKWTFRIELFKILPAAENTATYPRCIKVTGDAPKQYLVTAAAIVPIPEDFDPDEELVDDEPEDDTDSDADVSADFNAEELPEGEEGEEETDADEAMEELGDDQPADESDEY